MLGQALVGLRDTLSAVRLPLQLPSAAQAASTARRVVNQLDDYVLPRLANIEAPLLAVVGGSTGAGKSTLVNSLIGRVVTQPGVIRPTTKAPVLIHNTGDESWFSDDRILPGLIRSRVSSNDQRTLQLVGEQSLPAGLAILDAPDVDSVVEENRNLASQLLQAADLWLFVTSAARYADAVPWEFLSSAAERGAAVAVVLDRVPPAAMTVVPPDLGRLMTERGLAEAPLFAVPETVVDDQGLLPDQTVAAIRTYLATLAADKDRRQQVVMQTLDGAIGTLVNQAGVVSEAVDAQADVTEQLYADASKAFAQSARAVAAQSADGTLLKGEVLSRWHDFVGTGDLMRQLDQTVGRLRDRLVRLFKGEPPQGHEVTLAASAGLQALIVEEGAAGVERAVSAWQGNPAGRQLLKTNPQLSGPSAGFADAAAKAIRDWQSDVLELVGTEGKDKRKNARLAALGVNGAGAALMLVIFFSTGGITGLEGGVAVGASALAQRLLEAIFGDDAVRRLSNTAKQVLDARVEALMASELTRFTQTLDQMPVEREQAGHIRACVEAVNAARAGHGVLLGQDVTRARDYQLTPGRLPELPTGGQPAPVVASPADAGDDEVLEAEIVDESEELR